jgi:hypothetical protein
MIVMRRIRPSTSILVAEDLTGVKDGVNQVYTTPQNYKANRIIVTYNGQSLYSPIDFLETGDNEITFIYLYPTSEDIIKAIYEISYD